MDDYLSTGGIDKRFSVGGSGTAVPSESSGVPRATSESIQLSYPKHSIAKEELFLSGYGKQFGEKVTYSAGVSYATGLIFGGVYGFYKGLRRGGPTPRLRFNAILNGCSQNAPVVGSEFGAISLFYCCFNNLFITFRGADDQSNAPIAGAFSGALYKCQGPWRLIGVYSLTASAAFTAIDQLMRVYC